MYSVSMAVIQNIAEHLVVEIHVGNTKMKKLPSAPSVWVSYNSCKRHDPLSPVQENQSDAGLLFTSSMLRPLSPPHISRYSVILPVQKSPPLHPLSLELPQAPFPHLPHASGAHAALPGLLRRYTRFLDDSAFTSAAVFVPNFALHCPQHVLPGSVRAC